MTKRPTSQPIATYVFDAIGIVAWLAAALTFYREENFVTTVPAEGLITGVANEQLMHIQLEMLIIGCMLAVVGATLLSASAIIKSICRTRLNQTNS